MNHYLIEKYYNLKVLSMKLLDSHFGTEIYLINTDKDRYIVKKLPLCMENVNNEGNITEYLYSKGLNVARLLKNKENTYVVKTPEFQFTVQDYIEGETLSINTAPEWFMNKSADFLGQAALLLKNYRELPIRFGKKFCSPMNVHRKIYNYQKELKRAKKEGKADTIPMWEKQINHLKRIAKFHIHTKKLTYANSHGDFHIGQAIVKNKDITVIDWSSACCLPICLDVITSYVFSNPTCSEGKIDAEGLKKHISQFTKIFPLTEYDIQAMPYMLYFWHCMCNYRPDEYADMADGYKPLAMLINKLLDWLYDNVEELSEQLKK